MKLIFCSLFLLIVLSFYSCQGDIDFPATEIIQIDSTKLKELIQVDTMAAPGQDTISRIVLNYDARQRLSNSLSIGYIFGVPSSVFEFTLSYAGNDSLPQRGVSKQWNSYSDYLVNPPNTADTVYWFYSGGKVVKDSLWSYNSFDDCTVTNFTEVNPNQYHIEKKTVNRYGLYSSTWSVTNVYLTMQNNNFIELKDTILFFGGPLPRKIRFSYDSKENPFRKLSIHYPFPRLFHFGGYITDILPSYACDRDANNFLTEEEIASNGNTTINFTMGYEYSSQNLPLLRRYLNFRSSNLIYRYGR